MPFLTRREPYRVARRQPGPRTLVGADATATATNTAPSTTLGLTTDEWKRVGKTAAIGIGAPLVGLLLGPVGFVAGAIVGGTVIGHAAYDGIVGPPPPAFPPGTTITLPALPPMTTPPATPPAK